MRGTFALVTIAFVSGIGIGYFAQSAGAHAARGTERHATDLAAIEKLHKEEIEATLSQDPGFKVLSYVPKYKNIQIEDGVACDWFAREGEYKLSSESSLTKWHAKGLQALNRQSDGSWKFALIIGNEQRKQRLS